MKEQLWLRCHVYSVYLRLKGANRAATAHLAFKTTSASRENRGCCLQCASLQAGEAAHRLLNHVWLTAQRNGNRGAFVPIPKPTITNTKPKHTTKGTMLQISAVFDVFKVCNIPAGTKKYGIRCKMQPNCDQSIDSCVCVLAGRLPFSVSFQPSQN